MELSERVVRLENHLKEHPSDYQSVIALYKLRSRAIERERFLRSIPKRRLVAECRKKRRKMG